MHFPFARRRAALALLALAGAAACKDASPTLTGDQSFPGGSRPVTLEAFIPASQYLTTLGRYTGFETAKTFEELVVANQYQGSLSAHALERYEVPRIVSYSQNGSSVDDSLYTVLSARVVAVVDTLGSSFTTPATVQLYPLTQPFDWQTATWTLAMDSTGNQVPWTQPGGTKGTLYSFAAYTPHAAGDSVYLPVDTARIPKTRPDTFPVLLQTAEAGTRLQIAGTVLRLTVKPSNATRDTTLTVDVKPFERTFVFTPPPPSAGTFWQAGGIFADRTIFSINFDQTLPGCAPADQPCPAVSIRDVQLNRVAIELRPRAVPLGYDALAPVPLEVWIVKEPELGARAPLVPGRETNGPVLDSLRVSQLPGDTVVELPLTNQTALQVSQDSLTGTFALVGEATTSGSAFTHRTFGLARFDPDPRLRIVYTLPVRPRLP
jgi:hypothetical protein